MKVLISGVAGFIGSHLSELLLSQGYEVVGIDNLNDYYSIELKRKNLQLLSRFQSFSVYEESIENMGKLESIFVAEAPEAVIHLAARAGVGPSFSDPLSYLRTNVLGTQNILSCSRQLNVRHFIFGSSSSVYGDSSHVPFSEESGANEPISIYAATKKAGEMLCHAYHSAYNMNITCLRFFTVYGQRGRPDMAVLKFIKATLEGSPISIYGSVNISRDYTFVSDIVAGIASCLHAKWGFEIMNLGNSRPVTTGQLLGIIEVACGKSASYKIIESQRGDVTTTYADISKAKCLIGYNPKVKIQDGIQKTVEWYKEQSSHA